DHVAGLAIKGGNEGTDVLILENDDMLPVQQRRASRAVSRVDCAEAVMPDLLAGEIDTQQAIAAKVSVDALAIGAWCAGCEAVFAVGALAACIRCERLPEEFAIATLEAEDRPAFGVACGRQEDAVLPQDGRRVTAAGHFDLPEDIFRVGPGIGELALGDALAG